KMYGTGAIKRVEIQGKGGNDLIQVVSPLKAIPVKVDAGAGNDQVLTSIGKDTLLGGTGNDTLRSEAGNEPLDGGPGNDDLEAGDGNDTLTGGPGIDTLEAGSGDDTLYARDGQVDQVHGGDGTDKARVDTGAVLDETLLVDIFI